MLTKEFAQRVELSEKQVRKNCTTFRGTRLSP